MKLALTLRSMITQAMTFQLLYGTLVIQFPPLIWNVKPYEILVSTLIVKLIAIFDRLFRGRNSSLAVLLEQCEYNNA